MNRKQPILFLILTILCLGAVSCRSSRDIHKTESVPTAWQRVRVPANIRIGAPLNVSAGANITFVRDTSITVSARFLGMEVFLLHATNDTALVIDKMHRQYIAESLSDFMAWMPFDINTVQDFLSGIPVAIPYKALPQGVSCYIAQQDGLMTSMTVTRPGADDPVQITYGGPVMTPFGPRASTTGISVPVKSKKYSVTIDWNWNKARWNSDVDVREIKLSDSYKKINPSDIAKTAGL